MLMMAFLEVADHVAEQEKARWEAEEAKKRGDYVEDDDDEHFHGMYGKRKLIKQLRI